MNVIYYASIPILGDNRWHQVYSINTDEIPDTEDIVMRFHVRPAMRNERIALQHFSDPYQSESGCLLELLTRDSFMLGFNTPEFRAVLEAVRETLTYTAWCSLDTKTLQIIKPRTLLQRMCVRLAYAKSLCDH